jgi:hypothetical protein
MRAEAPSSPFHPVNEAMNPSKYPFGRRLAPALRQGALAAAVATALALAASGAAAQQAGPAGETAPWSS